MASAINGKRTRSRSGGKPAGDTAGASVSGDTSGSSGSADSGFIDGLSGFSGTADSENGNDGDGGEQSQIHSGGSNLDGADGVGSSGGSGDGTGSGSDRGSSNGAGKRKRRTRAEIEEALAHGVDDVKVRVPSDLSAAKLGRKKKGANKLATVQATGLTIGLGFTLAKYALGPGYEFWDLSDAEKDDLAAKTVAALEALPSSKSNKVLEWIVKQTEIAMPFIALGLAGYATVGPRITLTKQLKAAQARETKANASNTPKAHGTDTGVVGAIDGSGRAVQSEAPVSDPDSGNGIGVSSASFGSAAGLFTPPPHIRS